LAKAIPVDHFDGFMIPDVEGYVEICRQTAILIERGETAGCADSVGGLPARVEDISNECCIVAGENVCAAGYGPDLCNIQCAMAIIPYFYECVDNTGPGTGSNAGDIRVYADLKTKCTEEMPDEERAKLLALVHDMDDDEACDLDTHSILTLHDAKEGPPSCETDTSDLCPVLVSSGQYTCKADLCPACSTQAHVCDHTCEFPCGSAAPAPAPACDTDSSDLCSSLISSGSYSCADDLCPDCPTDPHMCDKSCSFPCGPGHRRLVETRVPALALLVGGRLECSWDTFDDRVKAVAAVCCVDGESCQAGLAATCSYACGKNSPGRVCHFKSDHFHLNVLNNSYDRMYLCARSAEMGT
jgi:hypothetical protein